MRWTAQAYMAKFSVLTADAFGVIRCDHQGRKQENQMSSRSQTGAMIFLASLLLVCPSRGQDAAGGAPSTNDAIAKHMEAMEQEIKELRQQVASLKGTEKAASAAT